MNKMFLNYQNIADNYTPNNLVCSFPKGKSYTKLDPVSTSKPFEEYNSKGELIGYFWHYGESLNLEFNIDGEITVEDRAIILNHSGQTPSVTEGGKGQRAYNIVDLISWTCVDVQNGLCQWEEDEEFTYDVDSDNSVYISADTYLKNKNIELKLYNFRHEEIYQQVFEGKSRIIFNITPDLSKMLKRGIYYCSLTVFNKDVNMTIFDASDCTLVVK